MNLIKKSDVKNHLTAHRHNRIHLYQPESLPDATGFAGEVSEDAEIRREGLAKSGLDQSAPTQPEFSSNVTSSDPRHIAAPETSKSARL